MSDLNKIVDFLNSSKISYKEFDKLLTFYSFKYTLTYRQHLNDVCDDIFKFFEKNFSACQMKITTYDIEESVEKILYRKNENFNEYQEPYIVSFDFSKSHSLNGRIFFKIQDEKKYKFIKENEKFLDFIFFELKDILTNHLAIKQLKDSSFIDETTNLPNRKFLITHLSSTLPVANKENIRLAFLKIEVDRFKAVIEEFNYEIGNKVLRKLSNSLKKNILETDIVTKFEGNSLLICMQDIKDNNEISHLAQKCIDDFANQSVIVNDKTNQKLQKTICIGIAIYPDNGTTLDEIFRNTDIALEEAKNKGRSSFEFFKEEQNSAIDFF